MNYFNVSRKNIFNLICSINLSLIIMTVILTIIGCVVLYSLAGANIDPWASKQLLRYLLALLIMLVVAFLPLRIWYDASYIIYAIALLLLIVVPLFGQANMGSTRWINLGFINIQPSEVMKIALVVGLARYYHTLAFEKISNILYMIPPVLMTALPAGLIFLQPDLGTAILLILTGVAIMFVAGISYFYVLFGFGAAVGGIFVAIKFKLLHSYQIARILTFLTPDADPLGTGYNLNQAKIALGSGGLQGKGFLEGTQTQLGFLPEQHTDFIFTALGEEFGFIGTSLILFCYIIIIIIGMRIALRSTNHFARLISFGVMATFSFYVLINTAMVMGLLPVVGVPLPFISYGGTVIVVTMIGIGLVQSAHIYNDDDGFVSGDSLLKE